MTHPHHILRTWLAVLLTLTVALLPHHHHGEEVCTALETCDINGLMNDRHTGHTTDNDCDESDCQVQSMRTFLVSSPRHFDMPQADLLPVALLPGLTPVSPIFSETFTEVTSSSVPLPDCCHAVPVLRGPPAVA